MAIVGIDLGTTNSLIGRIEKGRPRLFQGEDGSVLIPSVVAFEPGSTQPIVGSEAARRRCELASSTIYSAKRFIGRAKSDVTQWMELLPFDFSPSDDQVVRFQMGDKRYTPTEIGAMVLRKLKYLAETQGGESVSKAVITVPAYFNDAQRQATKLAGELAGLEVARIVNEPTAACLAYGLNKKTMGNVAVFDLGGGTFDISILRVKDGVFEVLATNGDTSLGGDDFDHAIVRALTPNARVVWGDGFSEDPQARAALVEAAEKLKRTLTDEPKAVLEATWRGKRFHRVVFRDEFENWIRITVNRILDPCRQCLKDAGLAVADITDVILVGGSTRVPLVRTTVQALFGREPLSTLNPDEVVAMGATVQANILAGQMGEMLLLDVIPLSLGIETMGGVVSKIIERNATIPISASQTFTTHVEGQVSVDIHVLQGERELAEDNRSLARFQLRGLPPLPAGVPKIEVEFTVDANGILNVRAQELKTATKASVTVNPTFGLSDAEVEKMLTEAFDNAETDFNARFLAEALTEADSTLAATRRGLEQGAGLISDEERKAIEVAAGALSASLKEDNHKPIRDKIQALNAAARPLADKLLGQAVQEAISTYSPKEDENE